MKQVHVAPLLVALVATLSTPLLASSHREAPGITKYPKVDGTDLYAFRSYEAGRSGYVTLIANYYPFQDPYGAPNFFALDEDAFYDINVDRTGDGVADMTFRFDFREDLKDLKVPVGGQMVSVPVANIGPFGASAGEAALNWRRIYTMRVVRNNSVHFATNKASGNGRFLSPYDNVGEKSVANYAAYAQQFIYPFEVEGCEGEGRVFVGQRSEPFAVNVGEIFDLINTNPLGPRDAEPNPLAGKNITSFALELPTTCLTGSSPVIGVWTSASLPGSSGLTQVSRLGMPLVNEIVIGVKDKDAFNASIPAGDAGLATYITNPVLPEYIELLFADAGVRAPNNFPRADLVAAFATGIQGLNFLSNGQPHEMLRLNTSTAATAIGNQNNLGVLGGDNAGFPNGRRPGDDVVDIELRVAMGVLCHAFPGVFCQPSDAPSGNLPFTDGVLQDVSQFDNTFPYLRDPLPGSPNGENGVE